MKDETQNKFAAVVQGFRLPRYEELPDVGLYLEQVAGYVANVLSPLESVCITASMISNYVKKDLVSNPVKKRYSRSQIAALISIAVAKTVLSLEDIQALLDIQRSLGDHQAAYDFFCQELEGSLNHVFGAGPSPAALEPGVSDAKLVIRKMSVAVAHKLYLDTYLRTLTKGQNE